MNFKLLASVAAASMVLIGSSAHAQGTSNFGGLKAGVVLGYDDSKLEIDGDSAANGGFLYGATAGYDFDLGTAVIGVEAEATLSTAKWQPAEEVSLRAGRDLYVGARVGLPVTDSVLVYAKAGYSQARVELAFNEELGLVGGKYLDGYRVGGGLEYATGTKFGRLEYRFSDYGTEEALYSNSSRHQVVVVAGLRF